MQPPFYDVQKQKLFSHFEKISFDFKHLLISGKEKMWIEKGGWISERQKLLIN